MSFVFYILLTFMVYFLIHIRISCTQPCESLSLWLMLFFVDYLTLRIIFSVIKRQFLFEIIQFICFVIIPNGSGGLFLTLYSWIIPGNAWVIMRSNLYQPSKRPAFTYFTTFSYPTDLPLIFNCRSHFPNSISICLMNFLKKITKTCTHFS